MSLDEFLRWDDGTDTAYELIGGVPVAMAPVLEAHRVLATRLAVHLEVALAGRRPCNAQIEAGIRDPERADSFFVADIGVTCSPFDPGRQYMDEPIVLVEILSATTERHDRRIKIPRYRAMPCVQEILLVDSQARYAELHRRQGADWIVQICTGPAAIIPLASIRSEIPLTALYERVVLPDDEPA